MPLRWLGRHKRTDAEDAAEYRAVNESLEDHGCLEQGVASSGAFVRLTASSLVQASSNAMSHLCRAGGCLVLLAPRKFFAQRFARSTKTMARCATGRGELLTPCSQSKDLVEKTT
jgi:hypothetical protein